MKKLRNTNIRIFVNCLADYNAGIIHGKWINALLEPSEIYHIIETDILATSPNKGREWEIQNSEGFENINLMNESIEEICAMAQIINEWGNLGIEVIKYCGSAQESEEMLSECYIGQYHSLEHYAQEFVKNGGFLDELPEFIIKRIDYRSIATDLEYNGDVLTFEVDNNDCHIFNNY